jgi:hypothetical protein
MFVVTEVSSRKINRLTAHMPCAFFHSRRARCTSSRPCSLACNVFFKSQAPFVELMPQRANPDPDPQASQALTHLGQGQIHFFRNPATYHSFQVRYPRNPIASPGPTGAISFPIESPSYLINPPPADFKPPRNLAWPLPSLQSPQHPIP